MKKDYAYYKEFEPSVKVTCPKCHLTSSEKDVRIRNIESDVWNRDVLSFLCPECGEEVKGIRFI